MRSQAAVFVCAAIAACHPNPSTDLDVGSLQMRAAVSRDRIGGVRLEVFDGGRLVEEHLITTLVDQPIPGSDDEGVLRQKDVFLCVLNGLGIRQPEDPTYGGCAASGVSDTIDRKSLRLDNFLQYSRSLEEHIVRMTKTQLLPRLILRDVDAALDYYEKVFDAERADRFVDAEGIVVHASIKIGASEITLTQEVEAWQLISPLGLGGSPVLLSLVLDDPDNTAASAVRHGGEIIIPIKDRPYGKREGRLRDPFGHLWVLSKNTELLASEEIQRRLLTMGKPG